MKTEKRNSRKGSVLVVDDEEIMREVLETLLTAEGYRVDLAKTGEEGLEAYGRRAFDVVLLDVSMPGIGGLRALDDAQLDLAGQPLLFQLRGNQPGGERGRIERHLQVLGQVGQSADMIFVAMRYDIGLRCAENLEPRLKIRNNRVHSQLSLIGKHDAAINDV